VAIKIALEMEDVGNDEVSFYDYPENIKNILNMPLNYSGFNGYMIHTLDSFDRSNITID
jgi:hypothetical protein